MAKRKQTASHRQQPKQPKQASPPDSSPPPAAPPAQVKQKPKYPFTWKGHIIRLVLALALANGSLIYQTYRAKHKSLSTFVTDLPDGYALCGWKDDGPRRIYTVDDHQPNVDCILVTKDTIAAIGTYKDMKAAWDIYQTNLVNKWYGGQNSAKKSLKVFRTKPGSIILPGFSDAHAHLIEYGFKMQLPLDHAQSLGDVLDEVENYIQSHPDILNDENIWIEGMGWDQTRWKDWKGGFPTALDLSTRPLLQNRPISLKRVDGHASWVSPRALQLTLESLPGRQWPKVGSVEGGEIVRDAAGEVTGVFLDSATLLIPIPPHTSSQQEEFAIRAMKDALTVGLTSVSDAAMDVVGVEVFKRLADEGRLPIRVNAMASSDSPTYWGSQGSSLETEQQVFEKVKNYGKDGRFTLRSVKLFADGALGSWGAALLSPYTDNPSTSGILRIEETKLEEWVGRFVNDGWSVNIHCIGDRANKLILDIWERLLSSSSSINNSTSTSTSNDETILSLANKLRPRIEHAQIMTREDLERIGRLGVIASVQPTHATSDMAYAEIRLGLERIKGAYAYQTLLQSSPQKVLPLGSDFPVEGINPLLGFYAAVTRLDIKGYSPHGDDGWFPTERLTRTQALKGMTSDAAYASFAEKEWGSLSVGKKADFVVLDRDIMNESESVSESESELEEGTQVVMAKGSEDNGGRGEGKGKGEGEGEGERRWRGKEILEAKVLATVVDGKIAFGAI